MELPFDLGIQLQYVYIIAMIPMFFIWVLLFFKYPRYRKALLTTAFVIAPLGHFAVYFRYKYDWWQPISFMANDVTIVEDLILGMGNVALALLIYPIVSGRHFREEKQLNTETILNLLLFVVFFAIIPYFLFLQGIHSFVSEIVVSIVIILFIWNQRPDLIKPSVISSSIVTLGTIPFYIGIQLLNNSYSETHYHLNFLSGKTLLNIPIEDYVWYFIINIVLAIFYLYIFDARFENKK